LASSETQLSELARYCVPYVAAPGNSRRFERTLPYPLYVHHLHSFFYGGRRGLLLSVKWMMRTFCASSASGTSVASTFSCGRNVSTYLNRQGVLC